TVTTQSACKACYEPSTNCCGPTWRPSAWRLPFIPGRRRLGSRWRPAPGRGSDERSRAPVLASANMVTYEGLGAVGKVRWGIVGCGDVTEVKSGPAFQRVPGSSISAVMRRSADKAKDYAQRHGVPRWTSEAAEIIDADDV